MKEQIDIQVREDGSRVVKRNLENLDPAARKAATGVDFLKRALAGLGGFLGAREIVRMMDQYESLQNRLRSTGLEAEALTATWKELLAVSNATRSSVEGSVELYSRLAVSSKELGVSQRQLIEFTKSLNQAIILSGANAKEAEYGLIQLSQGMASGVLRGDELRSVMEQLPAVADVIAKGMGKTRGELRKMGEEGKISAQVILDAFVKARGELEEKFGRTVPTLGQSFQILKNNTLDLVGTWDSALGVSRALSQALKFLADNLDTVTRAVISLVAGLALVGGGAAAVGLLTRAVQALTAAIAANPLGAFLVVLTSVITAITLFRDKLTLGFDNVTTLGDLFRAFGEVVAGVFARVSKFVEETFGPLGKWIAGVLKDVDVSVVGVLRGVAKAADFFVSVWRGAVTATVAIFEGVPPALSDIFATALNFVLEKIGAFVNKAGELLSTVTEFAGLGRIASTVDFSLDNKDAGAAKRLGTDIAAAFQEGFGTGVGPAQKFLDQMLNRAVEIGQVRRLNEGKGPGISDVRTPAKALPVDQKEVDKAANALRSLLNTIQPSSGAVLELAKAQRTLNEAQRMGLITAEQNAKYLELARAYYEDIINPLKAYTRGLDEQAALLKVSANERDVETELLRVQQDMQRQGLPLTAQETELMRAKLQALRDLNEATQAEDALLASTSGKRRDFLVQLQALSNLSATGRLGLGDQATAVTDMLSSMGLDVSGTQAASDAMYTVIYDTYDKIDALRQKNLLSEQDAQMLLQRMAIEQQEMRLSSTQAFFGNLATLSRSGNKKLAAVGKAAAVAQATIDGVLAVQKALASSPPPLNYALAASVGVAAAANVAQIVSSGYKTGGYTGDGSPNSIAGVVHGREYVVNADATARNRAALEAMNAGADFGRSGGGQNVQVTVNNNAPGTRATATEQETPDGKRIEVTIEEVVARSVRRGGRIADAIEGQYGLNRAAGVAR